MPFVDGEEGLAACPPGSFVLYAHCLLHCVSARFLRSQAFEGIQAIMVILLKISDVVLV